MRGSVALVNAHTAIVRVPSGKFDGDLPIEVPLSEIFAPTSTDAVCEILQTLEGRLCSLPLLVERAKAEIYELGCHALKPRR